VPSLGLPVGAGLLGIIAQRRVSASVRVMYESVGFSEAHTRPGPPAVWPKRARVETESTAWDAALPLYIKAVDRTISAGTSAEASAESGGVRRYSTSEVTSSNVNGLAR